MISVVTVPVNVGEASGAFNVNPGTVGTAAVPAKSPANCILPFVFASASAMVAPATCASTYVFTDLTLGYFVSDTASVVTSVLLLVKFSFKARPGTVGAAAVPPKSPANCILPFVFASASAMLAPATCASTYVFTDLTLGYFVSDAASVVMFILLFEVFSLVANVPFNEATALFRATTSAFVLSEVFIDVIELFTATASAFVLSELLIAAIALFTFTTSAFAASELVTFAVFAFNASAVFTSAVFALSASAVFTFAATASALKS